MSSLIVQLGKPASQRSPPLSRCQLDCLALPSPPSFYLCSIVPSPCCCGFPRAQGFHPGLAPDCHDAKSPSQGCNCYCSFTLHQNNLQMGGEHQFCHSDDFPKFVELEHTLAGGKQGMGFPICRVREAPKIKSECSNGILRFNPPLKQTDALWELFSPKISKFFITAVLTLQMDILTMTVVKHYSQMVIWWISW